MVVDRQDGPADPKTVPTIRDLIRAAFDEGRSVRDLEQDSGYLVKYQTFQELGTNSPRQFPKETKTITGMAQALNVTETAVVLAYARGLGVPVEAGSNTFALRLPPDVATIEPDMQNALISMIRAAVRRARGPRAAPGEGGLL